MMALLFTHLSPNTYSVHLKLLTKESKAIRALLTQHSECAENSDVLSGRVRHSFFWVREPLTQEALMKANPAASSGLCPKHPRHT